MANIDNNSQSECVKLESIWLMKLDVDPYLPPAIQVEAADYLGGILTLQSAAGGTGSGFGAAVAGQRSWDLVLGCRLTPGIAALTGRPATEGVHCFRLHRPGAWRPS